MPFAGSSHIAHEAVSTAAAAGTNALRALRESIHYSVEDLAITSGLACSEINELENGDDADQTKLRRIANALKLSENFLELKDPGEQTP